MVTTRDRSDEHERRCATYFKAKINPNSGAVNNYALKGDLRTNRFLIECKCTNKNSITIKKEDIYKALKQANVAGKTLIFNIEFQKDDPKDTSIDVNSPETKFYNLSLMLTNELLEFIEEEQ